VLVGILVLTVAIFGYREYTRIGVGADRPPVGEAGALWKEFTHPGSRPTLVVLGDFFFMRERGNSDVYLRKGRINTLEEYLEFTSKNPSFASQYTKNNFTFLRPSASWGVMQLMPILHGSPNGVTLKLASQFTPDDFKGHNIVFIGSFKTMYVLKNLLHIFKLDYSTVPPSSFQIRDAIGDSIHVFRPERLSAGNLEMDYGVVAKGNGPDGSTVMMLMGFSESGVLQATKAACEPKLFETLSGLYPSGSAIDPTNLTLVLAAEGMTQSLFSGDIKYVAGVGHPQRPPVDRGTGDSLQRR
jgi:hypothetical protein